MFYRENKNRLELLDYHAHSMTVNGGGEDDEVRHFDELVDKIVEFLSNIPMMISHL